MLHLRIPQDKTEIVSHIGTGLENAFKYGRSLREFKWQILHEKAPLERKFS